MQNGFVANNRLDENDNPTGGNVYGVGIQIDWQNGPLGRDAERQKPNGAFVEDVIAAVIQRLKFFQESKFTCPENAFAITHCEEALHWLEARTRDREKREVEGTHSV